MNLIVDVGNTLIKLAVFKNDVIEFYSSTKKEELELTLNEIKSEYLSIKKGILSSVGSFDDQSVFQFFNFPFINLNHHLKFPFKNRYTTPKTLGVDRLALVSAAAMHYPNEDVLVIDAGTCVTFDFLNSKNEYLGGAISPGLRLRYKSLNDFTANLPLLPTESPKEIVGDSTANSIHSGVVFGVVNEIKGAITQYEKQYPGLTVILTGGDSEFLSKQLKNGIFATSNFLLEGLNFILEYNS
ncbi:MAG: type III pantothenate kinase [Bacteroidota bacterium]